RDGRQGVGRRSHQGGRREDGAGRREPHRRVSLGRHRHRRGREASAEGLLTKIMIKRVILLVMDSVGCGELPDAASYGDVGSNTLGNTARFLGGMTLPYLQKYGLGNLTTILGVPPVARPAGRHGTMGAASGGRGRTTGA